MHIGNVLSDLEILLVVFLRARLYDKIVSTYYHKIGYHVYADDTQLYIYILGGR